MRRWLKLMCSLLKDRHQRQAVQINNNFSSYKKVQAGGPQGSFHGLLLFHLFINDRIGKEMDIIREKLWKYFKVELTGSLKII